MPVHDPLTGLKPLEHHVLRVLSRPTMRWYSASQVALEIGRELPLTIGLLARLQRAKYATPKIDGLRVETLWSITTLGTAELERTQQMQLGELSYPTHRESRG